ncbi:MAG TPA: VanW family protein [bacterium]|nr:VanW family protein [bacterium]HMZ04222.1 VanW family protein [bacterium]HNH28769.1 VanW family protein [bacterium]HNH31516.1 VanW family protein [bacterium]
MADTTEVEYIIDQNQTQVNLSSAPSLQVRTYIPHKIMRSLYYFVLASGLILFIVSVNNLYLNNRIPWNTMVHDVSVGGMTVSQAREALTVYVDEFKNRDVRLLTEEGEFLTKNTEFQPTFDIEKAIVTAFERGHNPDPLKNVQTRTASMFFSVRIPLESWYDENRFVRTIINKIPKLKNNQPIDATVAWADRQFKAVAGRGGLGFDEEKAKKSFSENIRSFASKDIPVDILSKEPDVTIAATTKAIRRAYAAYGKNVRMYYTYDGYNYDSWAFAISDRREFIEFRKVWEGNEFVLYPVLNAEMLREELNRRVAPYMYRAKEDVTIRDDNGKIVVEGVARDGYYLDIPRSIININESVMKGILDTVGNIRADLVVAHLTGGISNPDNPFGITDVLATGVTDYFGSPENRKFNINHAAKNFQNIVVKPGEDFSFLKYLGEVDSLSGYLKELVIVNGDSSEPNWGGGVCQVSSTLFRTVFFAGLNVKKRTNHSYAVKYYEPLGLDATIFIPAPDLVFENDTKNTIIIQNLVDLKRTKMYFKLFGKKDGRKVEYEGPIDQGTVGEKNEHYRVMWTRSVELPDGTKRTDKFGSTYKNKDLVKKHKPDSTLHNSADSTGLRNGVVFGDSAHTGATTSNTPN